MPLAARHFLHQAGYCTTDQQQHNMGHPVSIQRQRIEDAKPGSFLEFTGNLLGKGEYGIVVETTMGAVKMKIDTGSRSFCEHALWRDYNYFAVSLYSSTQSDACKNRRNVKQHLPRPLNIFFNMSFAQIYEDDSGGTKEYTISLLGMEKLGNFPERS